MGFWETTYDVVDHVSTSLSIPLAVVGFVIAIRQINKSRSAAEAARDAATNTTADLNRAGILVLLPQLQRVEEQIERAVDSGSTELFIAWANVWRWQASQFRGYLELAEVDSKTLSEHIQKSVTLVTVAKSSLVGNSSVDLVKATKKALESIAVVTSELGALAALYGSKARTEDGNG